MFTEIKNNGELLAIIVGKDFEQPGIRFFTADNLSQQIGYMHHPAGKIIEPHVHNPVAREVHYTMEVLMIKRGKMIVDFFSDEQDYLESRILSAGDMILLAKGGHGFEVIEEVEMYEIKQGPYAGEQDKTRFRMCRRFSFIR